MRDILDKMLLIEAIETREPDFRFLMLEDNHIFIIEDDRAIQAVIDSIRRLGTDTDEGRAIAQRIFGKEPEDVTDQEVFKKIIAPGFDGVGPIVKLEQLALINLIHLEVFLAQKPLWLMLCPRVELTLLLDQ